MEESIRRVERLRRAQDFLQFHQHSAWQWNQIGKKLGKPPPRAVDRVDVLKAVERAKEMVKEKSRSKFPESWTGP